MLNKFYYRAIETKRNGCTLCSERCTTISIICMAKLKCSHKLLDIPSNWNGFFCCCVSRVFGTVAVCAIIMYLVSLYGCDRWSENKRRQRMKKMQGCRQYKRQCHKRQIGREEGYRARIGKNRTDVILFTVYDMINNNPKMRNEHRVATWVKWLHITNELFCFLESQTNLLAVLFEHRTVHVNFPALKYTKYLKQTEN